MWHRDVQRRLPPRGQGAAAPELGGSVPAIRCAAWRPLVAAAVLVGLVLAATPAGAHAVPASMDPAPNVSLAASPPEVVIRFTERVERRHGNAGRDVRRQR